MLTELMPKRLDLLSQLVPQAGVIALLVNPNNAIVAEPMIRNVQEAARAKGLQLHIVKAGTESEIQAAYATLIQLHDGALVVGPDPLFDNRSEQLVAMAARYAIPAIYAWRDFAAAGGLMTMDRASVLPLANWAFTPERSSTAPMVINLKTAQALGLTIPPSILARADEVIE